MTAPAASDPYRGRPKYPARRVRARLAAAGAAVLALAAVTAAIPPATAATARPAVRMSGTRPGLLAAASGQGQVPLDAAGTATVTLITGDQVTVTRSPGGRDTAEAVPGSGQGVDIREETGPGGITTSLQAIPQDETAQHLISSGLVNQGLFDLQWLVTHGDTGPDARIPVTIAYAGKPSPAQLRADTDSLPGAAVRAVSSGSSQVQATVTASDAAAFWAALTATAPAASPGDSPAGPALAGGATGIWLTGHQVAPAASAQPQAGQPLYTVTETITRTTGPLINQEPGGPATCNEKPDQQANLTNGPICWNTTGPGGFYGLWGVAGPGQGVDYPFDGTVTCVDEKAAAAPALPVCSAWQLSYSVPAGVYYSYGSAVIESTDNTDHTLERAQLEIDVPQFTVTGNTSFTIDADRTVPVTVATPQPGEQQGMGTEVGRQLSDGSSFRVISDIAANAYSTKAISMFAVPTPAGDAATIGQYFYTTGMSLQRPQLTATATPGNLTLHPLYAVCITTAACNASNGGIPHFSGRQNLQVVDAGQGTASDFSDINARGKLALIHVADDCNSQFPGYCPGNPDYLVNLGAAVLWPQIENALQAGAAGVLFDAGTDPVGNPSFLPARVVSGTGLIPANDPPVPDLPVAAIDNTEANALLAQMAKDPVTVSIDDHGQTPYAYFVSFTQEGQIPDSLNYTVTSNQLAEIENSYQSASPATPVRIGAFAERANYDLAGGGGLLDITSPAAIREYYGPLSPSNIWVLDESGESSAANSTWKVFDEPDSARLDWSGLPAAPGAPVPDTDAYQAQPDWLDSFGGALITYLNLCAGCTQGGVFYPVFYDVNGASPDVHGSPYGFAPGSIHLYNQAGQEIQPAPVDGIATYPLTAQQARYKLVTPTTTWDFTDPGTPAADHTPQGTYCGGVYLGTVTAPCQADPLVFLRYNAGLSLADTIAPGTRQLQVTGYHQDPSAPPVTSLKLWTSTDGGTTWQPARVTGGSGKFTVTYIIPAGATSVSIKAQASDAAGNDISQELDNAYAVAAAPSGATRTD